MIKIILIDDEDQARNALLSLLSIYASDCVVIGQASSITEGKKLLEETPVDVVFLDVQMPDGTGFDLLQSLKEITFKVVFVSAYDHFALTAFRFSAVDFLLKPVLPEDFKQTVEKIKKSDFNQSAKIKVLLNNHQSGIEKIVLPSQDELLFVKVNDIIRCESDNNYTHFFLNNGDKILVSRTLKDYEELLEPIGFFRIHKSSLINLSYLKKYKKGEGGTVTMEDGTQLEVSRRRKEDFLKVLNKQQ